MTDKTRQDSGSTHIIRYALELGLLWIGGDGRDKVREALDALDTLEAQLEAIGAGGVEPLCKQVAPQTQAAPDERAAFEKWLRVKPCGAAHDFGWEAWRARAALAATYPTQQGLELANCKGGKWLTVVYRDIQPGDEARAIGEHPKVSALSWSHALHDRDAALAAKAKQGERP